MSEWEEALLAQGRPPDQHFAPEERLFRRFAPDALEGNSIALDAIELPDMSVSREKYSRPEWVLNRDHRSWGVAAFTVADIPAEIIHRGESVYNFRAVHMPQRRNYAHTEVQAFEGQQHLRAGDLDPEVHLRFRERLLWRIRITIQPKRSKNGEDPK